MNTDLIENIVIFSTFIFLLILIYLVGFNIQSYNNALDDCERLKGCDVFRCQLSLSEGHRPFEVSSYYLQKYNFCLIERGVKS